MTRKAGPRRPRAPLVALALPILATLALAPTDVSAANQCANRSNNTTTWDLCPPNSTCQDNATRNDSDPYSDTTADAANLCTCDTAAGYVAINPAQSSCVRNLNNTYGAYDTTLCTGADNGSYQCVQPAIETVLGGACGVVAGIPTYCDANLSLECVGGFCACKTGSSDALARPGEGAGEGGGGGRAVGQLPPTPVAPRGSRSPRQGEPTQWRLGVPLARRDYLLSFPLGRSGSSLLPSPRLPSFTPATSLTRPNPARPYPQTLTETLTPLPLPGDGRLPVGQRAGLPPQRRCGLRFRLVQLRRDAVRRCRSCPRRRLRPLRQCRSGVRLHRARDPSVPLRRRRLGWQPPL